MAKSNERRTTREVIEWHPISIKYPIHATLVLVHTNDGICSGYWDKHKEKWFFTHNGNVLYFNSDTHVRYWAYWPSGVKE